MATGGLNAAKHWLCLVPRRLALDALCLPDPETTLVTMRKGQRSWVVSAGCGLPPGSDLATVLTARPELRWVERQPDAETAYMQQLAALGHNLGAPVHLEQRAPSVDAPAGWASVWVEVGRSARLFEGLEGVRLAAQSNLAANSLNCGVAIAPTMESARLLAAHSDGAIAPSLPALSDMMQTLPVHALHLPGQVIDGLRASGIQRCDALFARASDQIGRRYGTATTRYLDRLLGRVAETRAAHRLPRRFEKRIRFDGNVHSTQGLRFPLRHLFGALELYLRAIDSASQQVRIILEHVDAPDTHLTVSLTASARDADHWLLMCREHLSRLELPEAVSAIVLHCDRFQPLNGPQMALFDAGKAEETAWRQTVERLLARLGEDAVWTMGLADDHRPERAWRRQHPANQQSSGVLPPAADRPLWMFDPPRPLPHSPKLAGPAERIESGWWEGNELRRDYFLATGDSGMRLWVYQDRRSRRWYLHGLWA
ncbi:MAG: DNA polymerase Y family protein [Algiphilus sp.]